MLWSSAVADVVATSRCRPQKLVDALASAQHLMARFLQHPLYTLMAFDKLAWQRRRRKAVGNAWTYKYEKTPKGFLVRVYRNMKSRVEGVQKREAHLYQGLPILDKQVFYEWALADASFLRLFDAWVTRRFNRRLSPSIDRKESQQGYELWNLQWVTHAENSSRTRRRTW